MLTIEKNSTHLIFKFSSQMRLIEDVLQEIEKNFSRLNIKEPSSLIIVLRELLTNAVVHGNQKDSRETVLCKIIRLNGGKFKIEVKDSGSGFDYSSLDMDPHEDQRHIQRRGYVLIKALSDRIEFNKSGNKVTVFLNLA